MPNKKSLTKKLRDLQRSVAFIKAKRINSKPNLKICPQHFLSISPLHATKLSVFRLPMISLSPKSSKPTMKISQIKHIDIAPRIPFSQPNSYQTPELPSSPQVNYDDFEKEEFERNRENVRNTLKMIDIALGYRNHQPGLTDP